MKDIGNGLNYAEAIISQAIPGLKVCIEYQIRQTFSLAFPRNCIIGRHDHSVSGPHLHTGLLWDISSHTGLLWDGSHGSPVFGAYNVMEWWHCGSEWRQEMEILSRSSVRTISLYETTTLQGKAVLESVVQTSGSRETKECLRTRMPSMREKGWPGRSRAIYLSSSSGRDHKTCLFSFEAGLKPSSPDGRGTIKPTRVPLS